MLSIIRQKLATLDVFRFSSAKPKASVLIALTDQKEPEVILTQRSSSVSTHCGEVAFPGGKQDRLDQDLLHTALRESEEEIGLSPTVVEIIGSLDQVISKHGLQVTPWVGVIPQATVLTANPEELDAIFRVPLKFFMDSSHLKMDILSFQGCTRYMPAWEYEGYIIWGLTAWLLTDLLNQCCDANIPTELRPEHEIRKR